MAGLMHDLGHGPYSHLFDAGVVPALLRLKNRTPSDIGNWSHERASCMLFDHMIEKYSLPVEEDEIDKIFIKDLILSDSTHQRY